MSKEVHKKQQTKESKYRMYGCLLGGLLLPLLTTFFANYWGKAPEFASIVAVFDGALLGIVTANIISSSEVDKKDAASMAARISCLLLFLIIVTIGKTNSLGFEQEKSTLPLAWKTAMEFFGPTIVWCLILIGYGLKAIFGRNASK